MKKSTIAFCCLLTISFAQCAKKKVVLERYKNGQTATECDMKGKNIHGECIEYYMNGKIMSISHWQDSLRNGVSTIYYKSGKLEQTVPWVFGLINGSSKEYYENGILKAEYNYLNGKLHGISKYYSENGKMYAATNYLYGNKIGKEIIHFKNGIKEENYWIYLQGKNFVNHFEQYDSLGNWVKKAHRAEINLNKDTFLLGESIIASIYLTKPLHNRMQIIVGKFDNNFVLQDSAHLDTVDVDASKGVYTKQADKMGLNTVRGIARDYETYKNKNGQNVIYSHDYYFTYRFFVKPKEKVQMQ